MTLSLIFRWLLVATLCVLAPALAPAAQSEFGQWKQALTLFGTAKYPTNFAHFDYVNPRAPKGGELRYATPYGFDSLNNFILKGQKAPGLDMIYDSLMTGALDEPQSYYPLVATQFRIATDGTAMEFTLNPKARWHDGTPITAQDVVFSLDFFKTKADPTYRMVYEPLLRAEATSARTVRFVFADASNREQTLLAATMPILPKHYYTTHAPDKTTLEPPLGSSAYRLCAVEAGRRVNYCRVRDYWARQLPVMVGQANFDRISYEVYRDESVALEAFKSGAVDMREEMIARNWATAYESPAKRAGKFIMERLPGKVPQGMQGFVFNLRRPQFADARVREAIGLAMDFEWMNRALFYNAYARNRSFFMNTPFEANTLPDAAEDALLAPYKASLPAALWQRVWAPPCTDGSGNNRTHLLRAQQLLNDAGWKLGADGLRHDPKTDAPLRIEFLLAQPSMERVVAPMRSALKKLGIEARIRVVDSAQYQKRVDTRDFDIVSLWINRGLHYPGIEQQSYWHSAQATVEGSNNLSGLALPVVDDLVMRIGKAKTMEELAPAARALDRVLLNHYVVIPHWHSGGWRLAYWQHIRRPQTTPPYSPNIMGWWYEKPTTKQ